MFPGIYIAAIITTCLALLIIGGLLFLRAPREDRPLVALLVLVMLPMSAAAFCLVRMPLDGWLSMVLGKQSGLLRAFRTLYAPLTEEPAKLWPLLIPWFYRRTKPVPVHLLGLAIGLGFGIGEAWMVALLLASSPAVMTIPWYLLGGYMTERLMACLMHAAFTAAAMNLILQRGRGCFGLLVSMGLHFIANFPIFLAGRNAFGLSADRWKVLLQIWVWMYFLAMGGLFARLAYGKRWLRKLARGSVRCPECGETYEHPIFGVNLLHRRYERCPRCMRWHLVSAFDMEERQGN